ncbi:hypothetical protein JZ751_028335 [Albula glossodonta]|uniref:Uncharacterized protein n=1 Tax=Albula glossodonta TaxID=121402 RepID=A0A8T2NBF0_9TELE|nr:hypothetical protein JZ751_028335 [Albula glossodonta]
MVELHLGFKPRTFYSQIKVPPCTLSTVPDITPYQKIPYMRGVKERVKQRDTGTQTAEGSEGSEVAEPFPVRTAPRSAGVTAVCKPAPKPEAKAEAEREAEAEAETDSPEVIYDDVPCEILSPDEDELIYEDVQRAEDHVGADNGWSSSEFESYDEQSDTENKAPTRSKVWKHRGYKAYGLQQVCTVRREGCAPIKGSPGRPQQVQVNPHERVSSLLARAAEAVAVVSLSFASSPAYFPSCSRAPRRVHCVAPPLGRSTLSARGESTSAANAARHLPDRLSPPPARGPGPALPQPAASQPQLLLSA